MPVRGACPAARQLFLAVGAPEPALERRVAVLARVVLLLLELAHKPNLAPRTRRLGALELAPRAVLAAAAVLLDFLDVRGVERQVAVEKDKVAVRALVLAVAPLPRLAAVAVKLHARGGFSEEGVRGGPADAAAFDRRGLSHGSGLLGRSDSCALASATRQVSVYACWGRWQGCDFVGGRCMGHGGVVGGHDVGEVAV